MMTRAEDTAEAVESNIPDEPELMQLWRRLIEIRDELVEEIPRFESPDHPERLYLLNVAHVPDGADKLRRADEQAKVTARQLRDKVDAIDREIRKYTSDGNDRGFSLQRLRALVDEHETRISAARGALERWWSDRDNTDKRHAAQLLLWRLATGHEGTPSDLGLLPDLDALRQDDTEYRRERAGAPSGKASASIGRILKRVRGLRVE